MPLREAPPYTAALEVTFASTTQSGYLGSSSTIASGKATSRRSFLALQSFRQ